MFLPSIWLDCARLIAHFVTRGAESLGLRNGKRAFLFFTLFQRLADHAEFFLLVTCVCIDIRFCKEAVKLTPGWGTGKRTEANSCALGRTCAPNLPNSVSANMLVVLRFRRSSLGCSEGRPYSSVQISCLLLNGVCQHVPGAVPASGNKQKGSNVTDHEEGCLKLLSSWRVRA